MTLSLHTVVALLSCPQDLVADDISPGVQLSTMLADILEDASSLHSLSLANNHMDDSAVANIMRALAANGDVQLTNLDLSGNNLLAPVSAWDACMWRAGCHLQWGSKASWLRGVCGGQLALYGTGPCAFWVVSGKRVFLSPVATTAMHVAAITQWFKASLTV